MQCIIELSVLVHLPPMTPLHLLFFRCEVNTTHTVSSPNNLYVYHWQSGLGFSSSKYPHPCFLRSVTFSLNLI